MQNLIVTCEQTDFVSHTGQSQFQDVDEAVKSALFFVHTAETRRIALRRSAIEAEVEADRDGYCAMDEVPAEIRRITKEAAEAER